MVGVYMVPEGLLNLLILSLFAGNSALEAPREQQHGRNPGGRARLRKSLPGP